MRIGSLSTIECRELLAANHLARLACVGDGRPYVVPISYSYEGLHLYAFSVLGKKIEWMRANPLVSLVVEEHGRGREWKSVVVDGKYEELPDRIGYKLDRERAWTVLSKQADWWEPGALKPEQSPAVDHPLHLFFRISVEQLSGRAAKE